MSSTQHPTPSQMMVSGDSDATSNKLRMEASTSQGQSKGKSKLVVAEPTTEEIISKLDRNESLRRIVLRLLEKEDLVDGVEDLLQSGYLPEKEDIDSESELDPVEMQRAIDNAFVEFSNIGFPMLQAMTPSNDYDKLKRFEQAQPLKGDALLLQRKVLSLKLRAVYNPSPFELPFKFSILGYEGEVIRSHKSTYEVHITQDGKPVDAALVAPSHLPFRVFKSVGSTYYCDCQGVLKQSPDNGTLEGLYWFWSAPSEALHFVNRDGGGGISLGFKIVEEWNGGVLTADAAAELINKSSE
ncbi:hypothetical protein SISSUDRAFT_1033176 [Sistotremastrum suecicum HHB10207 ss-3]|uniref:Uncharacterized protein n=1 Tax=Sistotremastrum suecicum HHB10207 ss-3 TaxID=1314776 RepID=A0A166DMU9_9AGAM|nr:hypothetical protein SISSUDRAFT_1033176 [Sistotremastrum suecicum HHB10207 ss-3]